MIEDDADIREPLLELLRQAGYEVVGAEDGAAGLDAARRRRPDVILLDMQMPIVDGWEFLRTARGEPRLADICIVVFSATPHQVPGAAATFLKPLDFDHLLGVLAEILSPAAG